MADRLIHASTVVIAVDEADLRKIRVDHPEIYGLLTGTLYNVTTVVPEHHLVIADIENITMSRVRAQIGQKIAEDVHLSLTWKELTWVQFGDLRDAAADGEMEVTAETWMPRP